MSSFKNGHIFKLSEYLSKKDDQFRARGATEAQSAPFIEAIDRLDRFLKTKEGFAWDQKPLKEVLLEACYAEMAKHNFK